MTDDVLESATEQKGLHFPGTRFLPLVSRPSRLHWALPCQVVPVQLCQQGALEGDWRAKKGSLGFQLRVALFQ